MQLKFKRYTGSKGMLLKENTYCLEAVLQASADERERITTFNRWSSQVWILGDLDIDIDEEEYKRQVMKVSLQDLARGVRFEYTNFNNVIRTENLIACACKQVLATVNMLATFDGTERVVEVDEETAEVVVAA